MPTALKPRLVAAAILALPALVATGVSIADPAVRVHQGADGSRTFVADDTEQFQSALAEVLPGDTIELRPGVTYRGPFVLQNRGASDRWITIRSIGAQPAEGVRIRPEATRALPKLVATRASVIVAAPGANHYRLVDLEIAPAAGRFLYNVVDLGSENDDLDAVPHHIRIEHCYIHGDPRRGSRRGVALNGAHMAVVDSHLSDFKEVGADSQAIAGWNGPGPFEIVNNYLEGAGENIMFGGADPLIPELVPSDIVVRGNHFAKPLTWRGGDRTFAGAAWSVKNLFELKNARRVTVERNLFEHNWRHGQDGTAILFTVRNQDGAAPWSTVEDVTFASNVVRRVGGGVLVLGRDDNAASGQASRISIRHNLFVDVGGDWGHGRLFVLMNGARDVAIEHNTAFHTESFLTGGDTLPHTGVLFENNIVQQNQYGLVGSGTAPGRPSLERYFPDAVFRGNLIIGGSGGLYPGGNAYPPSAADVKFVSATDFRLAPDSPYKGRGFGDRDPGFDGTALEALGTAGGPAVR